MESWRKRSATGAVLTGIAFGFQQVFEKEREEPAIIMTTSGDPPRDLPVEAEVEHGRPRRSVVNIRPWLLDRAPPGAARKTGPTRPAPRATRPATAPETPPAATALTPRPAPPPKATEVIGRRATNRGEPRPDSGRPLRRDRRRRRRRSGRRRPGSRCAAPLVDEPERRAARSAASPEDDLDLKPTAMRRPEPLYGYVVGLELIFVSILNLTVTHGKGAPAHPATLRPRWGWWRRWPSSRSSARTIG